MESLSRVKKFQELRDTVESNQESETISPKLSVYAERLNKINPVLKKAVDPEQASNYEPVHIKRMVSTSAQLQEDQSPLLKTDYIHEFLDEVRQYNVSQGYRTEYNTDLEILKSVKASSEDKDENVAEITQQIKVLIEEESEDDRNTLISDHVEENLTDTQMEEKIFNEAASVNDESQEYLVMFEETQKLKLKIEDYEKELQDMNASVLSSHRFLNYVVFALVLLLLIMLGFAIYWVLYSQGYY
jgi:hypothetical protein